LASSQYLKEIKFREFHGFWTNPRKLVPAKYTNHANPSSTKLNSCKIYKSCQSAKLNSLFCFWKKHLFFKTIQSISESDYKDDDGYIFTVSEDHMTEL